jgi:hypothetical protein
MLPEERLDSCGVKPPQSGRHIRVVVGALEPEASDDAFQHGCMQMQPANKVLRLYRVSSCRPSAPPLSLHRLKGWQVLWCFRRHCGQHLRRLRSRRR